MKLKMVATINFTQQMTEYKYAEITRKIIGASMKVHNYLGRGFQERIYQRCLAIEFEKMNLKFEQEKPHKIFYENILVGSRRVDFLIEDRILLEIKATGELENAHLVQAINYVDIFDLDVGLLINFGSASLQFRRLINKRRPPEYHLDR